MECWLPFLARQLVKPMCTDRNWPVVVFVTVTLWRLPPLGVLPESGSDHVSVTVADPPRLATKSSSDISGSFFLLLRLSRPDNTRRRSPFRLRIFIVCFRF